MRTSTQEPASSPELSSDMLDGIKAISKFTGWPERQVYHMASNGTLPGVFQIGRKWVGLKSEIRAGLLARARGAAA